MFIKNYNFSLKFKQRFMQRNCQYGWLLCKNEKKKFQSTISNTFFKNKDSAVPMPLSVSEIIYYA